MSNAVPYSPVLSRTGTADPGELACLGQRERPELSRTVPYCPVQGLEILGSWLERVSENV